MTNSDPIPVEQDEYTLPAPARSIRAAAQSLARSMNVVHRPQGRSALQSRLSSARTTFEQLYAQIGTARTGSVAAPGADPIIEVRENPRLLRSVLLEMDSSLEELDRLPRVSPGSSGDPAVRPAGGAQFGDHPRVAAVASGYLDATGGVWSPEAFGIFVSEAQRDEPLLFNELWPIATLLKFVLLERILSEATSRLKASSSDGGAEASRLSTHFRSLRGVGHSDWVSLIEPLIFFDRMLQQDPAGAYSTMDFDSRQSYRKRVAELARYSEFTEPQVAAAALDLATSARRSRAEDSRVFERRSHIGYYLIDKGAAELRGRIGYHPRMIDRLRIAIRNNDEYFYIGGAEILTVLLIGVILAPLMARYSLFGGLSLAFLLLLLPAAQGAIDLITNTVTALFHAEALPKLDFAEGIPEEFATLVAVPTLLINEQQVTELVESLEVRFLANQDPNLHFALLTDLPDSTTRPREQDRDALVDLAVELIGNLNRKYASGSGSKHGELLLLHRHRIYNARQEVWMGWERKRGKLLDLNKYLKGEFNAFPVTAGRVEVLPKVRYIITLDSDTQLPRGVANQLVGAIAHPLNRAVIDPKLRVVTEGYGILQPRVGVSVQSAARSRLAAIYSGQTGFDIYTRAVSDAYQDLFGEGIFTGKGIYEVSTFHSVLDRRFPRNALLSHDLIEGSYARAGLATDVEVIDDYPSHYSAFTRRKHRWVRGDWQIAQWLFARVPDESGRWVRNPISTISRWKIFDNLRRSLVEPFTFVLLVAGWLGLPGGALYWTLVTVILLVIPSLVQLGFSMGRAILVPQPGAKGEAFSGFLQALGITLLNLVFLAHQTLLAVDAIARALIRRFITGRRLLEWETAAEAEANTTRRTPVDRYLAAMPAIAAGLAVIVALLNRRALIVAAPILLLWGFASAITRWLNKPPAPLKELLSSADQAFLREMALRIWRFYADFGDEKHNFLIPDNVEEKGMFEAARVSPTNIGMLLNARQAACEFGFLTISEFVDLTTRTLATIARLPKVHGHIYNWYNTQTLEPLHPITISSVDSGNLAASLYTLSAGAKEKLRAPIVSTALFEGVELYMQPSRPPVVETATNSPAGPGEGAGLAAWINWMNASVSVGSSAAAAELSSIPAAGVRSAAAGDAQRRVSAVQSLLHDYTPWLLPQFATIASSAGIEMKAGDQVTLEHGADYATRLDEQLARVDAVDAHAQQFHPLLTQAVARLRALAGALQNISEDAARLADEMDFSFLLEPGRGLLSIGYEVETEKLHTACYDMLASEARIATFIAVAKGEIPQQSWFKLGRTHTRAFDRSILLSWTGTMFEYLMPSLWMRSYPDTLVSRTLQSAVDIQRRFASSLNVPWGISESGFGRIDDQGHYPYHAFGIPDIALKWDAGAGPVVSPYSSFLALGVDSINALANLRKMADAGWIGTYGFYEAIDFTGGLDRAVVVREWMAHHQGMSLLAILNLLKDNLVQQWFHATPQLQATELLLHEKPMREAVLRAEQKQQAFASGSIKAH
ncbi:MAG TPA: glucoamylase family protein [Acidisarcina sp.]